MFRRSLIQRSSAKRRRCVLTDSKRRAWIHLDDAGRRRRLVVLPARDDHQAWAQPEGLEVRLPGLGPVDRIDRCDRWRGAQSGERAGCLEQRLKRRPFAVGDELHFVGGDRRIDGSVAPLKARRTAEHQAPEQGVCVGSR